MIRRRSNSNYGGALAGCCMFLGLLLAVSCSRSQVAELEYHPETIMAQQLTLDGQQVSEWMMGVNRLYPGSVPQFPAPPAGYSPVYLTHYGRHGSRYLAAPGKYAYVHSVLSKASEDGMLTELGADVYARYEAVAPLYKQREGELTSLGALQHRAIAARMVQNFPALFRGASKVVANSTNYERTMLSMQNFTQTLAALRPGVDIRADASRAYMGRINQHAPENPRVTPEDVRWKSSDAPWRAAFWEYYRTTFDWRPVCGRLFTDTAWAESVCDPFKFVHDLYSIALVVPGCPEECKGFFDVFTSSELSLLGQMDNYAFYMEKSRTPLGNKRGCYLSESVLGDIIDMADEDMSSGVKVRLRFGHDGCIMALYALLKLEGWDSELTDPAGAWKVWDVSQIPMAANFQIVLFGRGGKQEDMVFMMLHNEAPLSMPLDEVVPGYYRWEDFLEYCSGILSEARAALEK